MRNVLALAGWIDRLVTCIGRVGAWAVALLVLVTIFDILTRNASQSEWPWLRDLIARQQAWFGSTMLQELEWHLHTVLFTLCLGMVYLR